MITSAAILIFARKIAKLSAANFILNVIIRCVMAFSLTMLLSASPLLLFQSGLLRLVVVILVSLLSFTLSVWFIGLNIQERIQVRELIKSITVKLSILKLKHNQKV
jgi:hypothetical protein